MVIKKTNKISTNLKLIEDTPISKRSMLTEKNYSTDFHSDHSRKNYTIMQREV